MSYIFVITGVLSNPRQYYVDLIEGRHHKVSSSVTSRTDFLLTGQKAGSKLYMAKKLGVKIIGENDLYDILDANCGLENNQPKSFRFIRHVSICGEDEDLGECEAMFDGGLLIGWWHRNDTNWRNEYFSPFMRHLGFLVKNCSPTSSDISAIRRHLGLNCD